MKLQISHTRQKDSDFFTIINRSRNYYEMRISSYAYCEKIPLNEVLQDKYINALSKFKPKNGQKHFYFWFTEE